jgi:hypothetical protein
MGRIDEGFLGNHNRQLKQTAKKITPIMIVKYPLPFAFRQRMGDKKREMAHSPMMIET